MSKQAAAMRARLREHANPKIAAHSTRFFKTGRAVEKLPEPRRKAYLAGSVR